VTHTPPSAAASGGYPPRTARDGTRLPPYPGDAAPGGHRSARRPGPVRRLFGRRRTDEDLATAPDRSGPRTPDRGDTIREENPAEVPTYRAQHRGAVPAGRLDPDHAAQEHLAAFRPEAPATSPTSPTSPTSAAPGPERPAAAGVPLALAAGPAAQAPPSEARFIPNTATAPAPPATAATGDGGSDDRGDLLYQVLGGLALRDLTLVESLLQVVEKLESNEDDAGQLELLFRIDHLATRMRRNSENLLVLAGHDTGPRDLEPVPLLDVARAAISEITDYSRAQIASLPDIRVAGVAADDLSHILAELLENATSKSPESASVILRAEKTGDGTMVISVEDSGIGIPSDQLAAINMRLGRAPVVDPAVTRHMGLYVVGRLAQRHGIRVQLRERPYGGITANVITPSRLIQGGLETPPIARRPPGRPESLAAVNSRPSRPGRPVPPPAAVPEEPPRIPAPPAPRFSPADPSTLPRRSPGQNAAVSPPPDQPGPPAPAETPEAAGVRAGRIRDDLADFRLGQREARSATPEIHHSNGLPRREPGGTLGEGPDGGPPAADAEPT